MEILSERELLHSGISFGFEEETHYENDDYCKENANPTKLHGVR